MAQVAGNDQERDAIPAWRRIATTLAREIREGHWRDGQTLPAAVRLAQRFGVHRHTVRKSLKWLHAQGLLQSPGARAQVVAPRLPLPLPACIFLPEHLRQLGMGARCELLACATERALPPGLNQWLPYPLRGPLLHVVYTVMADGHLLCRTEAWLPASRFSGLSSHLAAGHALGHALRLSGIAPACQHHHWIEAGVADVEAVRESSLALRVCVLALDAQGGPLKLCLHHLDAGRVRLAL